MGSNGHRYREHLYHLRSHPPGEVPEDFVDRRDSFLTVYMSIVPFLAAEYYVEANYYSMPSGIIFPLGYLLFWAFYYTYYKPGYLEEQLSTPKKWDLTGVPTLLVGVMIWFMKVTVVELATFVFGRWIIERRKRRLAEAAARKAAHAHRHHHHHRRHHHHSHSHHTHHGHAHGGHTHHGQTHHGHTSHGHTSYGQTQTHTPPPAPKHPSLPRDIVSALATLGLAETCNDWHEIHKRYRELAKQYHPDLNREITAVGRRFMMIDAAYRKLGTVKTRYFQEKRDHAS